MGDLAQAIVDLGKAAQLRTGARRRLVESTSIVAAAIRKQLRTEEDMVSVQHDLSSGVVQPSEEASAHNITYSVVRFEADGARPQQALCRDLAVLEDIDGVNGRELVPVIDRDEFHRATAQEREHFVVEAPVVIAAFERLLRDEAGAFTKAAGSVAKLVVR